MNVLVLGASGFVGSKIREVLNENYNVYGTYYSKSERFKHDSKMFNLNIDCIEGLQKILIKTKPDVIISSIRGDFEKLLALQKYICSYLNTIENGKLIFLSSANVFDNRVDHVHYEEDETDSITAYGKYKIKCEEVMTEVLGDKSVIIRIPGVWGKECPRIIKLRKDIENNQAIKTWSNIFVNKTTDEQIAGVIRFILESGKTGIFHVGSLDICDYTEFQKKVCEKLSLGIPKFIEEKVKVKEYQAVLSARNDIPDYLKLTIDEIIQHL